MLAHAATAGQAKRMVEEHLLNSKEFWGERVIPAIARDDPAFKDPADKFRGIRAGATGKAGMGWQPNL
jgi:hypothetical protein